MPTRAHRRLATVLFVDIVDSTRVASDVGDRRWRELLGSFRRAVRRRLKAEHAQEQDTAGDGFFATFDRPAAAIRTAVGVIGDVHAVGLDARCGIHFGELERIDGKLGGIAAHIGARVMAQAGPADILVTATVHDLVVGSGVTFEDPRDVELKGVPGRWTLYRVASLDGVPTVAPLGADDARGRLGAPQQARRSPLGRRAVVLVGGVLGALALVALGAVILTLPRDNPSLAGAPSPTAAQARPPSMVKIDSATNEVVLEVVDRYLPIWNYPAVVIVDGVLWQDVRIAMVRRDIVSGEPLSVLEERVDAWEAFPSFGSMWFRSPTERNQDGVRLRRVDPISGRELTVVTIEERTHWYTTARDGFYFLTDDDIVFVDPDTGAIISRHPHGFDPPPDAISWVAGQLWLCECDEGRITEWDPETDTAVRTVEFAQRGFLVEDQRDLSQSSVSTASSVIWLMDRDAGTITPVDTLTAQAGQPIGIPRESGAYVLGLGSIWISANDEVLRIDLETKRETSIPLPDAVQAGGLAVDEATGVVWVSNYVPQGERIPDPLPPEPSSEP